MVHGVRLREEYEQQAPEYRKIFYMQTVPKPLVMQVWYMRHEK